MAQFSRGETRGIAERTLKNLENIEDAFERGEDVHVVTQLVCSLLGLVVFPWEKMVFDRAKELSLAAMKAEGWPDWTFEQGNCGTLYDLMKNLRHGIAHSHVSFSSESRQLDEVEITITNRGSERRPIVPPVQMRIRGDELRTFSKKLGDFIIDTVL